MTNNSDAVTFPNDADKFTTNNIPLHKVTAIMINVLVTDGHALFVEGLKQILVLTPDIVIAGEARNGREALLQAAGNNYDLMILDISLPDMNGLDVLSQVKHKNPKLPVLILTEHSEKEYAFRALRAGASGYLTKETKSETLFAVIRKLSQGGKHISSSFAEKLVYGLDSFSDKLPHERLTCREFQVMTFIAEGKSVKETAFRLSLSAKTVSTYRSRILDKMALENNAEIIHYALRHDLLK